MLVYGIIGSFTHCVMMCGPIAAGQMSIRLMHLESNQLSNNNKLKCALSYSYYLGKASTYGLITLITYLISSSIKEYYIFRYIAFILVTISAIICLKIALNSIAPYITQAKLPNPFKKLEAYITNKMMKKFKYSPFGLSGFGMGMFLGFIPCGLVFSAITLIIAFSNNWLVAFLAAFSFGIGTFPALFLVSILGQNIFRKQKIYLNAIYAILMTLNGIILIYFGTNLF